MLPRITLSFFFAAALALAGQHPLVTGVDSIGLTVSDLDRSVEFYTNVLTFEKVAESEHMGEDFEHLQGIFGLHTRTARLRLGGEFIELTEYLTPRGRPAPVDAHSNDHWFQHVAIVVSDMDRTYARLRQFKVEHASTAPQRLPDWNNNAAGIRAFYFHDPDGHALEVIYFPTGKGAAKWQDSPQNALFLGIDHSAIVISDTEASLRFYRDILGLQIAGESENYGTEQEHLNNVFGAHLRITSLRAASGPGVEFLEYLAPRDGRPYPPDEKSNDLIHWQTKFLGTSATETAQELRKARAALVSPGVVELHLENGFRKSLVARDPDGHAVEISE
jgi:catechol 2,3-dioxygenase-like lactoylglutathione lyase family enzyme